MSVTKHKGQIKNFRDGSLLVLTPEGIFRTVHENNTRPVTYRSEFLILHAHHKDGAPVPRPLSNSFEQDQLTNRRYPVWSIIGIVPGQPLRLDPLTPRLAYKIGRFLSTLHRLPATGYGRLGEESDRMAGQDPCPVEGECNRADKAAICHSDLSGEHIFTSGDRLTGVIDFGSPFIAVPAWEFATLGDYHGWDMVAIILEGYSSAEKTCRRLLDESRYLAAALGPYTFYKAVTQDRKPSKIRRRLRFVSETLDAIQGRGN